MCRSVFLHTQYMKSSYNHISLNLGNYNVCSHTDNSVVLNPSRVPNYRSFDNYLQALRCNPHVPQFPTLKCSLSTILAVQTDVSIVQLTVTGPWTICSYPCLFSSTCCCCPICHIYFPIIFCILR